MGYNARNDEIRDNVTRMRQAWAAERQALATVRRFNASNGKAWFWPKITAALTAKHPWLIIACDACGTVVDLGLREAARPGSFGTCCPAGRSVPALQWPSPAAHRGVGEPSVDLSSQGREGSSLEVKVD
jgi:hypothetical protein